MINEPKQHNVVEIDCTLNVKVIYDSDGDVVTIYNKDTMDLLYYSNADRDADPRIVQAVLKMDVEEY